jgi:carbon-monoxide dehydrogenase medium subunit
VAERALVAERAGKLLEGTKLAGADIAAAAEACQEAIDPLDDVRASAEYRCHLVGVHVRRTLERMREERGPLHG